MIIESTCISGDRDNAFFCINVDANTLKWLKRELPDVDFEPDSMLNGHVSVQWPDDGFDRVETYVGRSEISEIPSLSDEISDLIDEIIEAGWRPKMTMLRSCFYMEPGT